MKEKELSCKNMFRINVTHLCDLFKYLSQLGQLSLIDEADPKRLFYPINNCYNAIHILISENLYDIRVSYQSTKDFKPHWKILQANILLLLKRT